MNTYTGTPIVKVTRVEAARLYGEENLLAVEALRKARATEHCRTSPYGVQPDCTLVNGEDFEEIFVAIGSDARDVNHRVQASALLDGFSVDEVTAAEEALGASPSYVFKYTKPTLLDDLYAGMQWIESAYFNGRGTKAMLRWYREAKELLHAS